MEFLFISYEIPSDSCKFIVIHRIYYEFIEIPNDSYEFVRIRSTTLGEVLKLFNAECRRTD